LVLLMESKLASIQDTLAFHAQAFGELPQRPLPTPLGPKTLELSVVSIANAAPPPAPSPANNVVPPLDEPTPWTLPSAATSRTPMNPNSLWQNVDPSSFDFVLLP
jgi:hypothetical protein